MDVESILQALVLLGFSILKCMKSETLIVLGIKDLTHDMKMEKPLASF